MLVYRPKSWTRKPPPGTLPAGRLANGLIGCYLFNEGGGLTTFDGGVFRTPGVMSGAGLTWSMGINGPRLNWVAGGGTVNILGSQTSFPWANYSIVVGARVDALNVKNSLIELLSGASNDVASIALTAAGTLTYTVTYSLGVTTFTATVSPPQHLVAAITSNRQPTGADGNEIKAWLNGVQVGTTATSGLGASGGYASALIGDNLAGNSNVGQIDYCYIWGRVLAPAEIQSLYLTPFQMFAPSPRASPLTPPVVAATGYPAAAFFGIPNQMPQPSVRAY